ncbi:DUF389 domain-containing protein [Parerythrobacter aurantius]|uniref:DUF389 domain-containing protein n=1 Tax=Parerythrobacter aurantius TaxID=3127706 RepID=UPI00324F3FD6
MNASEEIDEAPKGRTTNYTLLRALVHLRSWWREAVVEDVDQDAVIEGIRDETMLTSHYIFMITMSAGIAVLGLLLSSPAVVIGAMLLSPLMSPIVGTGFAMATGDIAWLKRCLRALAVGSMLAIAFCALIVLLSPLQTVTTEIAGRTRPNLFDLLVALFSALAGTYATIRGKMGTIVGVAIATALMPPLAVIGFGLATVNWTVFGGALMLFATNLMTIAFTAAIMARLYGFRSRFTERQNRVQDLIIIAGFVLMAVPLALSLRTIAWEANASRQIRTAVDDAFVEDARIDQLDIRFDAEPLRVEGSVLTPRFAVGADDAIGSRLARILDRQVDVELDQFLVRNNPRAAEQAQLATAREEEESRRNTQQVAALTERLSAVAGVPQDEITVDRNNRRVLADARPLPGLGLEGYRLLEQRAARGMEGWEVRLRPPPAALPSVTLVAGEIGEEGQLAAGLMEWAASRTGLAVVLSGPAQPAGQLAARLRQAGVAVEVRPADAPGNISARWQDLPDAGR